MTNSGDQESEARGSIYFRSLAAVCVAVALSVALPALGDEAGVTLNLELEIDSPVVARVGGVPVTRQDLDLLMSKIPEGDRAQFVSSRRRIGDAMEKIVLRRAGAQRAINEGLLDDPDVVAELYDWTTRELSKRDREAWIEKNMLGDYDDQARELFLADKDRFLSRRRYSFSHVLVRTANRSEVDAMRVVVEVYDRVKEGDSFDELIAEYGEDERDEGRPGYYQAVSSDNLDRNFARALERLSEPGDISEPVRSRFGWHLIRLDESHPREPLSWEDAKEEAVQLARQKHRERLQKRYYSDLVSFNDVQIEPGAIETFQRRYGYDPDAFEGEESAN